MGVLKTRHQVAWVENTGLENVAPDDRGGKCGSGRLQGRIQKGPNPNHQNAANIKPNADFTSLKYIEQITFDTFLAQGDHL